MLFLCVLFRLPLILFVQCTTINILHRISPSSPVVCIAIYLHRVQPSLCYMLPPLSHFICSAFYLFHHVLSSACFIIARRSVEWRRRLVQRRMASAASSPVVSRNLRSWWHYADTRPTIKYNRTTMERWKSAGGSRLHPQKVCVAENCYCW